MSNKKRRDIDEVWNVIIEKLDSLDEDLKKIVATGIDLELAISTEIEAYDKLEDNLLVRYLTALQNKFLEVNDA